MDCSLLAVLSTPIILSPGAWHIAESIAMTQPSVFPPSPHAAAASSATTSAVPVRFGVGSSRVGWSLHRPPALATFRRAACMPRRAAPGLAGVGRPSAATKMLYWS